MLYITGQTNAVVVEDGIIALSFTVVNVGW